MWYRSEKGTGGAAVVTVATCQGFPCKQRCCWEVPESWGSKQVLPWKPREGQSRASLVVDVILETPRESLPRATRTLKTTTEKVVGTEVHVCEAGGSLIPLLILSRQNVTPQKYRSRQSSAEQGTSRPSVSCSVRIARGHTAAL